MAASSVASAQTPKKADANGEIDPRSVNQTSALAAQPLRAHTAPLYQSVCLQKQFQHINSVLLWRPDVATRADQCSYIPSVDTLFVSCKGGEQYLSGVRFSLKARLIYWQV